MRSKAALIGTLWGALAGGLAVLLADPQQPPRPRLHTTPWSISKEEGTAVTPQRSLELPMRYGDFDLDCRVVLPRGGELDLVFRKVEYWAPGGGEQLEYFHSRFAVLRMSTHRDGPGFLDREAALFDDVGGVRVGSGEPGASLHLECRGRQVRGVVNGQVLAPCTTQDEFGNLAVISRGGSARVLDFKIQPWPPRSAWPACAIGALIGAVGGLLLALCGASAWSGFAALLLVVGGSWLGANSVLVHLSAAIDPLRIAVLACGLCAAPAAFLLALPWPRPLLRVPLALLLGAAAAVVLLEWATRQLADELAPFEDERMDVYFGKESGTAPFDALTGMLRCSFAVHTLPVEGERYDVLLLGGGGMFDDRELDKNAVAKLPALVKRKLGVDRKRQISCAAIPTKLSHVYQQLLLFRRFYRQYRPRVVVMGISGEEAETYLRLPARRLAAEASRGIKHSGLWLRDLWGVREVAKEPVQTPAELRLTLDELLAECRKIDSKLLLAVEAALPPGHWEVVQAFAAAHQLRVVQGFDLDKRTFPIDDLAAAVAALLGK